MEKSARDNLMEEILYVCLKVMVKVGLCLSLVFREACLRCDQVKF